MPEADIMLIDNYYQLRRDRVFLFPALILQIFNTKDEAYETERRKKQPYVSCRGDPH